MGENTFQAFFSGSFIRRKRSLLKKCCVSKASFLLMREVLNSGNLYTGNFFRSQVIFSYFTSRFVILIVCSVFSLAALIPLVPVTLL